MAARPLFIVAACSRRKRLPVPSALRMREVPEVSVEARVAEWCSRVTDPCWATLRRPARDLYAGDYWCVVHSLLPEAAAQGFAPQLWVASAGHGLVSSATEIPPYDATFTLGELDSVAKSVGENA